MLRQCCGQIIGLYPIVSSCGLGNSMVDLDELLKIDGSIILVDMPDLEFI
jgi:hypothetical protein